MTRLNPLVVRLLRSPLHPLVSGGLMLLQVTGRRTGRRYWIPVGYQRDGDTITVLVSHARRKQWWRNYREPGPVELHVRGHTLHGRAQVLPPESAAFRETVERTLRRLPGLGRQFGIAYDRRLGLTAAQCKTVGVTGAVVSISASGLQEVSNHESDAGDGRP
ncbi:MAG: nitroreductase/quinone reductase family protein [Candidatus Binatia bacterium]